MEAEKANPLNVNFGIRYILNSIDIYGRPVTFYVGKNKKTVTNVFGGIMTVIFILLVISYFLAEFVKMHSL